MSDIKEINNLNEENIIDENIIITDESNDISSTNLNNKSDNNSDIDSNKIIDKKVNKKDNKYDNYISERKKELILDLIKYIGYESFEDPKYIAFIDIQNDRIEKYIINMLDALRTVFKTYNIRSMTRQNKDKRFCLNITRQLLQNIGYTLKMKTYPLIRNNIITSSTKYKIVKKK
jgi:hypothetical protein